MSYFCNCPRCGWRSLETYQTYSYCANCNYNSVEDEPYEIPLHIKIMAKEEEKRRQQNKKKVVSLDEHRRKKKTKTKRPKEIAL